MRIFKAGEKFALSCGRKTTDSVGPAGKTPGSVPMVPMLNPKWNAVSGQVPLYNRSREEQVWAHAPRFRCSDRRSIWTRRIGTGFANASLQEINPSSSPLDL